MESKHREAVGPPTSRLNRAIGPYREEGKRSGATQPASPAELTSTTNIQSATSRNVTAQSTKQKQGKSTADEL